MDMAPGYDDYEEEYQHTPYDRGDHGHVPSSHGHDSGSRDFGPTSDFSTTLLSDDGRFLGMKLPKDLADKANTFFPSILSLLSEKGEQYVIPIAERMAEAAGHDAAAVKRIGSKAGNATAYSIILSSQILNLGRNTFDSAQRVNELNVALRPLAKSRSALHLPLSGNNEVIANARAKISGIFWQRFKETLASTISVAPTLIFRINEQKAKNHDRDVQREFAAAKGDVKKQAELLEKEITVGSSALGFDPREMEAAKELMIENKLKAYEANYKTFESSNRQKIKNELDELAKDLTRDNYRSQLAKLKRFGVNTDHILAEIEEYKSYLSVRKSWAPDLTKKDGKTKVTPQDKIAEAIEDFRASLRRGTDRKSKEILEEVIKAQYVRKAGAFNEEWLEFSPDRNAGRGNRAPTHVEELEQKIAKIDEARQKAEEEAKAARSHGKDDKTKDVVKAGAGLAGGVVGEMFTSAMGIKAREQYEQPIALDRILHLRRVLEKEEDGTPEQVPGIAIGKNKNEKDMSYVQYVHQIFQQHQKDCKRTEIGSRFVEHFEKAHWDDAAIHQLSDAELTPYEYAVKTLAKRIKDGRIDAIALIDLVGNRQIKLVHDDGRSFGPRGAGKSDAGVKVAMAKVIDEKTALLHGGKTQTEEQFNEKLGDFVFSVADLKQALGSNELDKEQRAFVFTLFSDVAGSDEKLCGKLGISNERCNELRKESSEHFTSLLDGAVAAIAEMIERDPEGFEKNLKLTDKQKEMITSLAHRSEDEGKHVVDAVENREELKSLETVVANTAMTLKNAPVASEENDQKLGFMQRIKQSASHFAEKLKQATADKALAKEDGHPRRSKHNAFAGDMHPDHPDADPAVAELARMGMPGKRGTQNLEDHEEHESHGMETEEHASFASRFDQPTGSAIENERKRKDSFAAAGLGMG